MIDGVIISPRRQIVDERGKVMHMLQKTDPEFNEFGEIYFSFVFPGVVKAWHLHERMIINYSVPVGRIKLVLFDSRSDSPTNGELQEIYLGEDQHCLVTIPPLVWNGFKGLGTATSLVANCSSIPHDPLEISRLDPHESFINYDWSLKDR